jgi:hypothetical protein
LIARVPADILQLSHIGFTHVTHRN